MRYQDVIKIILHEYKYEKAEWLVSVVLQWLIFTCVFFLLTISYDMEGVFSKYLKPMYPDGYSFFLDGYDESEIPLLEEMGFYDITFSDEGGYGSAVTDKLDGIWVYKFKAVFSGKDIWDEGLDEILSFIFFSRFTFSAICLFMIIIMLNNLSNSFAMKIIRRKKYIQMLGQLGCANKTRKKIFFWLFGSRSILTLVMSLFTNINLIYWVNKYMTKRMLLQVEFKGLPILVISTIGFIIILLMWFSFGKQWRLIDEN